jgi:hypothetical protein
MTASDPVSDKPGPLAEFAALRAEMQRIASQQWNVLALQITIAGAIFGFSLSGPNRELLLLIIPFSTYMLCGRYVLHTYGIRRIATYIREVLSREVAGGLGWEEWTRKNGINHQIGLFRVAHPAGVTFGGISVLTLISFIIGTVSAGTIWSKPWYVLTGIGTLVVIDVILTILVVTATWRARTTPRSLRADQPADGGPQFRAAHGAAQEALQTDTLDQGGDRAHGGGIGDHIGDDGGETLRPAQGGGAQLVATGGEQVELILGDRQAGVGGVNGDHAGQG